MLLLYLAEAGGMRLSRGSYAGGDILLFVPHLVCIALLASGMNGIGGIATALTAVAYALFAALYALGTLLDGHSSRGMGFLILVQVVLFVVSVRTVRVRPSFPEVFPAPRHGIVLLLTATIWLGLGPALHALDAPRLRSEAADAATKRAAANSRIAEGQFLKVAQCLQHYAPVDSPAYYPAALSELAATPGCEGIVDAPPSGFTLEYEASPPNAAGKRAAFRLVAGSVATDDGRRTMTTDENEWITLHFSVGPNELTEVWSSPLQWLTPIANCIERARDADSSRRYPPTIGAAARENRCSNQYTGKDSATVVLGGPRGRYLARYTPPPRATRALGGYTLSLTPDRDSLGNAVGSAMRSYLVDGTGAIHMTLRPRPATVADSVLPFCPERMLNRIECREYRLRQRWGVSPEMPRVYWTSRGDGLVAIGDTVVFYPIYHGIEEQDAVAEYRFAWRATDPDSVVPAHSRRSVAQPMTGSLAFRLPHVYREPGMMSLRFAVITRGGERYEYRDSVRVLPHAKGSR
jgi:hypothetical protein